MTLVIYIIGGYTLGAILIILLYWNVIRRSSGKMQYTSQYALGHIPMQLLQSGLLDIQISECAVSRYACRHGTEWYIYWFLCTEINIGLSIAGYLGRRGNQTCSSIHYSTILNVHLRSSREGKWTSWSGVGSPCMCCMHAPSILSKSLCVYICVNNSDTVTLFRKLYCIILCSHHFIISSNWQYMHIHSISS